MRRGWSLAGEREKGGKDGGWLDEKTKEQNRTRVEISNSDNTENATRV